MQRKIGILGLCQMEKKCSCFCQKREGRACILFISSQLHRQFRQSIHREILVRSHESYIREHSRNLSIVARVTRIDKFNWTAGLRGVVWCGMLCKMNCVRSAWKNIPYVHRAAASRAEQCNVFSLPRMTGWLAGCAALSTRSLTLQHCSQTSASVSLLQINV